MKLIVVLLLNVACIAICSGADGDPVPASTEDKDADARFAETMCPKADSRLFDRVVETGHHCFEMATPNARIVEKTLENFRDFFRGICQRRPIVLQCFLQMTTDVEVCHNEAFMNTFKAFRDVSETGMEFVCDDDGERFANLVYEVTVFVGTKEGSASVKNCSGKYETLFGIIRRSDVDISTRLYHLHEAIKTFAGCVHEIEMNGALRDAVKRFLDAVFVDGMKCVHPRDGGLVPCAEIDAGSVSVANICELKTHGTNMSLYDLLEEDAGSNVMDFFQNAGSEDVEHDRVKELVELECSFRRDQMSHFNSARMVSEMCLNDTEQLEFQLFGDVIESVYEAACLEDGKRLGDIMFEVYRLKNTGHGHAVWDCVDVVVSNRNKENVSSSLNMRFYHELQAFKGCLVVKLVNDETSVAAATSLIDETLRTVKCLRPDDGTTVLCETLVVKA